MKEEKEEPTPVHTWEDVEVHGNGPPIRRLTIPGGWLYYIEHRMFMIPDWNRTSSDLLMESIERMRQSIDEMRYQFFGETPPAGEVIELQVLGQDIDADDPEKPPEPD